MIKKLRLKSSSSDLVTFDLYYVCCRGLKRLAMRLSSDRTPELISDCGTPVEMWQIFWFGWDLGISGDSLEHQ